MGSSGGSTPPDFHRPKSSRRLYTAKEHWDGVLLSLGSLALAGLLIYAFIKGAA